MLVIKAKGLKKTFSTDPIDYKKLRKDSVQSPSRRFFKNFITKDFSIKDSSITEVKRSEVSKGLVLMIHGGAYVSGPGQHHWDAIKKIAQETGYTVWLCNYPKAPETDIVNISENIDAIYTHALELFTSEDIILMGDSVGGALATALTQRLVQNQLNLPKKLILISPMMDASMSNPAIDEIESKDLMLARAGVVSAKKMCAKDLDLRDQMISPLYGDFEGFPPTIIFAANHDIAFPDQQLARKKLAKAGIPVEFIIGNNMPHIWPLLPVMKEARTALGMIIERIKE